MQHEVSALAAWDIRCLYTKNYLHIADSVYNFRGAMIMIKNSLLQSIATVKTFWH